MEFQSRKNKVIHINNQKIECAMNVEKNISKRQQVEHILSQLQKSTDIPSSKLFYEKIKRPCLEQMVSLVFNFKKKFDRKYLKTVNSIINILKTGGGFAQFIADHSDFNKTLIFGFLEEEIINQNILNVFGQIFINLSRANPLKMLQIIKDQYVQNILITNLKRNQIFCTIYTAIFCSNQAESDQYKHFIHSVLRVLVNSVFQNKEGQSIFSNCICSAGQSCVTNEEDYSWPKQNYRKNSLQAQNRVDSTLDFCPKGCLNKQHPFFKLDDEEYYEQTIQAATNLCQMFQQITVNISGLYIGNVQTLLNVIIENHYIKQLFAFLLLNQKSSRVNKQELSTQILRLIFEISNISRAYALHSNITSIKSLSSDSKIEKNNFKKQRRKSIEVLLQICQIQQQTKQIELNKNDLYWEEHDHIKMLLVFQQISHYMKLFFQQCEQMKQPKKYLNSSSGVKIEKIGFSKYWILKIYYEILNVIKSSNHQIHTKYNLKKALPALLQFITQIMNSSKWNNIIHKLISKIIKLYIKVCYSLFYHQAVNVDKVGSGFLGFLIQNFRNKYFVFLDTMKFTSQGDHHTLFAISREISAELHSNRDLFWLFNKFPQWKYYMENDLQQYQHLSLNQKICDSPIIQLQLNKSKSQIQRPPSQSSDHSQSVQQIVDFYRDNILWETNIQRLGKLKTKNQIQSTSTNAPKSVDAINDI